MEHTENRAVGCVIMASGRAVRFGSNKLLADFGGAPLIARALDAAETPALAARVVVTRSPEVAELACKAGVKAILHSLPGRNDTVRLGLEALLSELPGLAGCIFLPGDQPLLRKESLEAMVRDLSALDEKERAILRLGFRAGDGTERLGSPVLFGSSYFGALCSLPEGKGGGVVFTDDDGLAARIRALGSHGWFTKYDSRLVGMNSRLDTLQAAVLRVKLPHLDTWIAARRSVAARYTERLGGLTPVVTPAETPYATHVYHQYTVKVPPACRDGLRAALAKEGIPSMVYYPGTLYEQPAYRDACVCDPAMRHAAALPAAVLSLPMDSELTDAEVERVADAVCRYFADNES